MEHSLALENAELGRVGGGDAQHVVHSEHKRLRARAVRDRETGAVGRHDLAHPPHRPSSK